MDRAYRESFFRTARARADLRANRTDWFRVDAQADGAAVIDVLDEIGYFGVTAQDFIHQLDAITAPEILVRINSPGGSAFDGLAIYNALRMHPAAVTTEVYGLAASAASVIFMAGDERHMLEGTQVLIHDAHALAIGNAADMRAAADFLDQASDAMARIYAERTGMLDPEAWRAMMGPHDKVFGPAAAVEMNVATATSAPDPAVEASWDLALFTGLHPEPEEVDVAALLASFRTDPDPEPEPEPEPKPERARAADWAQRFRSAFNQPTTSERIA